LLPPKGALAVVSGLSRTDEGLTGREAQIVSHLHRHGASFFGPLHEAAGGGFPQETVDAIWDLVWKGLLTNDTLHALRAYASPPERTRRPARGTTFRSRRLIPLSAEGRWTVVPSPVASTTAWATAMANQLPSRHGIVTATSRRSSNYLAALGNASGVAAVEETGRIRRGYSRRRSRCGAICATGRHRPAARRPRGSQGSGRGDDPATIRRIHTVY
jgi:ATP-dependent Lhr-like helicase